MKPSNGMVTLNTVSSGAIRAIQQTMVEFSDTPSLVPPPGGWRTKRCDHGLRCDEHEWLCEKCEPATAGEAKAKAALVGYYRAASAGQCSGRLEMEAAILEALRSDDIGSLRELAAAVSRIRGKRIPAGPIASSLYKLRRDGRVEGMTVL